MKRKKATSFLFVVMLIFALINITGCETTFEPLQENDRFHFSIFGVLDLSADTQWVRVMPITDSLFVDSDEPIDAEVTLTRLSTGEIIAMNDSLLRYSNSVYAWNFYTTTPLHASESYELKAEASDGRFSSATVNIPSDFPMPIVKYSGNSGNVSGSGIERLVVADVVYRVEVINPCAGGVSQPFDVPVSYLESLSLTTSGVFRFFINNSVSDISSELILAECDQVRILDREVLVVSGDEHWPDYKDQSEDEIYLPEVNSNIEDGLGVLTGIVSKRFPLQSCYDEAGEIIACPEN